VNDSTHSTLTIEIFISKVAGASRTPASRTPASRKHNRILVNLVR